MKQLLLLLALISPSFAQLPIVDYAGMFFATVQVIPAQPIRKVASLPATCTAVGSASSSNAVLYQGRVYQCVAANTWTFAVGQSAALTSGRVVYATTNGVLTDTSTFLFDGTNIRLGASGTAGARLHVLDSTNGQVFRLDGSATTGFMQFYETSGSVARGILGYGDSGSIFTGALSDSFAIRSENALHLGAGGNNLIMTFGADTNAAIGTTTTSLAKFTILPVTTTKKGLVIQAASGHTANLLETQNSSGTALAYVDASGRLYPLSVAFASLGTPSDGAVVYCSDCTKATPCAGSGNGALAKRINGAWDCD